MLWDVFGLIWLSFRLITDSFEALRHHIFWVYWIAAIYQDVAKGCCSCVKCYMWIVVLLPWWFCFTIFGLVLHLVCCWMFLRFDLSFLKTEEFQHWIEKILCNYWTVVLVSNKAMKLWHGWILISFSHFNACLVVVNL